MNRSFILGIGLGLLGLAGNAATVRAGLLPVNYAVNTDGTNYRWTYSIVLPSDVQIRSGDYFTVYDFAGYLPGTNSQPANWTFSTLDSGPVPAGVLANDNPSLPNLTWTYTGPTQSGSSGLGNFWAVSQYVDETRSDFAASSHNATGGAQNSNITTTTVPVPAPPVPEPGTLALAGLGLPLVALMRRRNRRKAAGTAAAR